VTSSLVSLVMLLAMLMPGTFSALFGSSFPGLADSAWPVLPLLAQPVLWAWVGLGAGVVVAALVALVVVAKTTQHWNPILTPVAALSWRSVYSVRLWLTDLMVVSWAVCGAQMIWFGAPMTAELAFRGAEGISYRWVSVVIVVGWMISLGASGARDPLVFGEGTSEYGRVLTASFVWAGLVAIAATMLKLNLARGYILLAFPLGLLGMLASRKLWRWWLGIKRTRQGLYTQRAVVVAGSSQGAESVLAEFERSPMAGYAVLAIALARDAAPSEELRERGLPLVPLEEAILTMRSLLADSLIVADGALLGAQTVRELSWELDPRNEHLVVAPDLLDVAGPRISMHPVAGLNLLHVDLPVFSGGKALAKRAIDIVVSAGALLVLAVPFAVLAILVKTTSRGPAFYHQTRVGLHGNDFVMWKFRSMVVGADQHFDRLREQADAGNTVQFKMKEDPRVTPIGRFIRKWSIDELPQLINVLTGSMSLVGPRPHRQYEVDQYTPWEKQRRFLVKPGITGLWQVSGRSDLTWEDSIRLDLYYVENWSVTGDCQLLVRTVKAVLRPNGAY
jgi:exopolysaccharide biosynthesis polyprenyl glycosylphosphotransferase